MDLSLSFGIHVDDSREKTSRYGKGERRSVEMRRAIWDKKKIYLVGYDRKIFKGSNLRNPKILWLF